MRYKIVKETKPRLTTFGKYKAKTVHYRTVSSDDIIREVSQRDGIDEGAITTIMMGLSHVIFHHLRQGDKVQLSTWGTMKLEIESEKVDDPKEFKAKKHIRGVRLHFLPESEGGSPELYQGIHYEQER